MTEDMIIYSFVIFWLSYSIFFILSCIITNAVLEYKENKHYKRLWDQIKNDDKTRGYKE